MIQFMSMEKNYHPEIIKERINVELWQENCFYVQHRLEI